MIDVSDGLLADAAHIADSSGVALDVDSSLLAVDDPLRSVGAALGTDPLQFVLTGGDDHALLATFPPDVALPDPWRVIGTARTGSGVTVDGAVPEGPTGHRHFG
jgi:thiamine-monophosphate kinase